MRVKAGQKTIIKGRTRKKPEKWAIEIMRRKASIEMGKTGVRERDKRSEFFQNRDFISSLNDVSGMFIDFLFFFRRISQLSLIVSLYLEEFTDYTVSFTFSFSFLASELASCHKAPKSF